MLNKFFRVVENLEASINSKTYKTTQPRVLDDYDFDSFQTSAKARRNTRTIDEIKLLLRRKNFVRMRRLEKDFKWLQKEFIKLNLNPEDARYIL